MNLSSYVLFQDLVKDWSHKEINVSSIYKNIDTGFCIQVICDEEAKDYIRLFINNKTIATKRSLLANYSDWVDLMENHIPNPTVNKGIDLDTDLPF